LRHGIHAFVKRYKFKGPVFEISALTREGCEPLIKAIYKHIKAQQVAELPAVDVDPRFVAQDPEPPTPGALA
jgi:GTP-binding protein